MNVYLASDHAGFALKGALAPFIRSLGHQVMDLGPAVLNEDDDYPELITPCARAVAEAQSDTAPALGIVIGGSGNGEAMAANRVPGIRAAVFYGPRVVSSVGADVHGYEIVQLAREHNDANILSLGARFMSEDEACEAVRIFLSTPFSENPRHVRRIKELG